MNNAYDIKLLKDVEKFIIKYSYRHKLYKEFVERKLKINKDVSCLD